MNGCTFCIILHHRRRRSLKPQKGDSARRRGKAMCLAIGDELIPCQVRRQFRGPSCPIFRSKQRQEREQDETC